MKSIITILFLSILFACNENVEHKKNISACEHIKYTLIHGKQRSYTQWKITYMEYVVNCTENPEEVKKLAEMEAEVLGEYTFIIYGMIESMEPYENIYQKYPIGFHTAGCDPPEMGEIYNEALKKELKANMNLDYDSIINEAFDEEE